MSYPVISSRRMPYDIDGTVVGKRTTGYNSDAINTMLGNGVASWLSSGEVVNLNKEDRSALFAAYSKILCFWFFFPEEREITHIGLLFSLNTYKGLESMVVQGAADSTNGMDGTWETAVLTTPTYSQDADYWRDNVVPVSFSGTVSVLRIGFKSSSSAFALAPDFDIHAVHLYGRKAAGETPDDILFCNTDGTEFSALKDFGDRPEGTTEFASFKLKNASPDKMANTINVQINHTDFLLSFSESGPWSTSLDIASIGSNAMSAVIYVKNELGPPLLTLGPKAARIIATVSSWA